MVDPDVARDFVHVDDVCAAFAAAGSKPLPAGAVYNLASGRQVTMRDLVRTAQSVFGVGAEPEWGTMANRLWDTSSWVGDPSRIASELGWAPQVSLEEGLDRSVEWYRANQSLACEINL